MTEATKPAKPPKLDELARFRDHVRRMRKTGATRVRIVTAKMECEVEWADGGQQLQPAIGFALDPVVDEEWDED